MADESIPVLWDAAGPRDGRVLNYDLRVTRNGRLVHLCEQEHPLCGKQMERRLVRRIFHPGRVYRICARCYACA